jgi:catechol 2,3-dioxygenase-like lactoylglutathione lyase family enzyme
MANTFHVSMYVRDLDAALDRYRRILGIEPAKVRPGYAKFEIADPPVIFSLVVGGEPGKISHLGIRYQGTGEVASEMARTKREGIDLVQQEGVTCCYAKADKFWVKDEDGMPWEMYTLPSTLKPRRRTIRSCGDSSEKALSRSSRQRRRRKRTKVRVARPVQRADEWQLS